MPDKTVVKTGIYFHDKMPVWFQELRKYEQYKYKTMSKNLKVKHKQFLEE
jgi:hypothetical protein